MTKKKRYKNKKYQNTSIAMLIFFLLSNSNYNSSLADDLTDDEIESNKKTKLIETKAREDAYNLNYYPKIQQGGSSNLFTGAATLKGNEVFARLGLSTDISLGSFDTNGALVLNDKAYSFIQPNLSLGWGIIDNFSFFANIPYRYNFGQPASIPNPWFDFKFKIIDKPVILSFQFDVKAPGSIIADTLKISTVGENQPDLGVMLLATKPFELYNFDSLYAQAGIGYKYRFPLSTTNADKTITNTNFSSQINYILDLGKNNILEPLNLKLFSYKVMFDFDISLYGYSTINDGNAQSSNYLSVRPNLGYKFSNFDVNLAFDRPILGTNIDNYYGIQAGLTYKGDFEYPKIFSLLLLKKIDPEDLEKNESLDIVDKGRTLYINNCSKCHILINPDVHTGDEWEPIVSRYKIKKLITKGESAAIIEFLKKYNEK